MAPKPLPTRLTPAVLSAEAAAMEKKLEDLKKAMEKERAKREALITSNGGSIWKSGAATGGLRNVRGSPGSATKRTEASPGQSPSPAAPASGASTARERPEEGVSGLTGSRLNVPAPKPVQPSRAEVLTLRSGDGMCCGPDDDKSLAAGAFSEADSHRSFLDALNEWRRGNKGDAGEGEATATSTTAAASSSGKAPAPATEVCEVQTESRPAARPVSAKPISYFEKLVINTASRQAGNLANGGSGDVKPQALSDIDWRAALNRPGSAPQGAPTPRGTAAAAAASGATASMPTSENGTPAGVRASIASSVKEAAAEALRDQAAAEEEAAIPPANPNDPLSILDRLEALERQRQRAQDAANEEDEACTVPTVTTHKGVLTKGTRLPDEVLLPPSEG